MSFFRRMEWKGVKKSDEFLPLSATDQEVGWISSERKPEEYPYLVEDL